MYTIKILSKERASEFRAEGIKTSCQKPSFLWGTGYPVNREYSTFRVVTTSRLKAPRPLVVHDNLKTFTKYSEHSLHNLKGLPQLSVLCALGHCSV